MLNKPFVDVTEEMGLGKEFSQSGLRRTFNDLARAAKVADIVMRSISGHLTERMQHHYSTVSSDEQRDGIARVLTLVKGGASNDDAALRGAPGGAPKEKAG